MNIQPLDETYFVWLYSQVADSEAKEPSLTYWKLLKQLFTTEFVWSIPKDENRSEDGKQLRLEFVQSQQLNDVDDDWVNFGCSMLELMVGLSRRLAFEAEGEPHYWFWKLAENIGVSQYSDDRRFPRKRVDDVLRRVINREYDRNGDGGFFPLRHAQKDQRKVELWYQLSAYVLEQE